MTTRYFTLKLDTSKPLPDLIKTIENRLSTLDGVEDVNAVETWPASAYLERAHLSSDLSADKQGVIMDFDQKVLRVLDTQGGTTTGHVAAIVGPQIGENLRTHSAGIRKWLLGMEKRGLVRRMDDLKPVCWVRVE